MQQAESENLKNRELTGGLLLDQAVNSCQLGDVRAGLLWMVRSMQLAPAQSSQMQWAIRTQLATWGREVNSPRLPPLMHNGSILAATFNREGTFLVTGGGDQTARAMGYSQRNIGRATHAS